jgi:hypothetical protein
LRVGKRELKADFQPLCGRLGDPVAGTVAALTLDLNGTLYFFPDFI